MKLFGDESGFEVLELHEKADRLLRELMEMESLVLTPVQRIELRRLRAATAEVKIRIDTDPSKLSN